MKGFTQKNFLEIKVPEDSGNAELVKVDENKIYLKIRSDTNSLVFHWFYFQLKAKKGETYIVYFLNADESTFSCWKGDQTVPYSAVGSYDNKNWFRVKTHFKNKILAFKITLEEESIFFATFTPYPYSRHQQLIRGISELKEWQVVNIGEKTRKEPIHMVIVGEPSPTKLNYWIIARQHPGESMAEWFMEGLIEKLQSKNPEIFELLKTVTFYLIPNMNPDGTKQGNLRTNARGTDLNRCWNHPDEKSSSEVFYVLEKMKEIGVHFFLDVHGEEQIPKAFFEKGRNKKSQKIGEQFIQTYQTVNANIQSKLHYNFEMSQAFELQLAHYFIAHKFNCVSLLLEMPFKHISTLDHSLEWPEQAAKQLGADLTSVIGHNLQNLISYKEEKTVSVTQQSVFTHTTPKPTPTTGWQDKFCLIS